MSLSNKLTAILVDDEPKAIKNLSLLLEKHCSNISILATCNNVDEAVIAVKDYKPNVVFLDIEMPEKTGFELFEETQENFQTIFVTAYDEYALKAFEVSAVDYLLKPIDVNRLKAAINKLRLFFSNSSLSLNTLKNNIQNTEISQIIVPFKDTQIMIKINNIICIKANQSYAIIYSLDGNTVKNYTYSKSLRYFNDLLTENTNFYRTNRSWLINTKKVISLNRKDNSVLLTGNVKTQISKNKIKGLLELL